MVPDFNRFFVEKYFSMLGVDTFLYLKRQPFPHSITSIENLRGVNPQINFIIHFLNFKISKLIFSSLEKSLKDPEQPKWVFLQALSPQLVKIGHLSHYLYTCPTLIGVLYYIYISSFLSNLRDLEPQSQRIIRNRSKYLLQIVMERFVFMPMMKLNERKLAVPEDLLQICEVGPRVLHQPPSNNNDFDKTSGIFTITN